MRTTGLSVLLLCGYIALSGTSLHAGEAAGAGQVTKVIETGADVAWSQGLWVSAPGTVRIAEDAPPAADAKQDAKKCLEVEVNFPGKGFMFYNAEPTVPLIVPGKLKALSVWCKGDGGIVNLVDGWGRTEVAGKKLEWGLGKAEAWHQVTFTIPAEWVQPIRIGGLSAHNWDFQSTARTISIRLSRLEATYDLSDTDMATGALKSWKPDPDGASRKDAPKECPRTPMLDFALTSGRESNVFAGEEPSMTVSARSWKAEKLSGTLTWSVIDLSSGEAAKAPLTSGTLAIAVDDRPIAQLLPLPTAKQGLYRFDGEMAWKDGGKDTRSLVFASIGAEPKDDIAARDASPYGLNTHGGNTGSKPNAWHKAGLRWIRDYAWGFNSMLKARDGNGAFTGWPWFPKILERYKKAELHLLPCMMDGIPAVTGDTKVPVEWRRNMSAIFSAFPDITHWELANEWDLDWKNERGANGDHEKGWPFYRAYHKAFGQVVSAVGAIPVENGRAGLFPEQERAMVSGGDFADIQVTNGHFYTGVSAPETSFENANTGGGGSGLERSMCYPDLLRESVRASDADGKHRSFWLTEFGWDTKAGFIVTKFQQAVFLQRGFMASTANGVDKSFWFFDFDGPVANAFFDGCGIMDEFAQPKLSYCALSALTRILPNPKYLGPLDAGPGTGGYLFEDHGKRIAALWTLEKPADGKDGPKVDFGGGKLYDFLGNPLAGTSAKLGLAPVFCVDVPTGDRWVKQACYELSSLRLVSLTAGDKTTMTVAVTNHRKDGLKAKLKLRLPEGWTPTADDQAVEAAAGASTKAELSFTISPKAKPGEFEAAVTVDEGGALCELRLRVLVGTPLTISAPALGNKPGETSIEVTVVNHSQRALDGTVTPRLPAGWKSDPPEQKLTALASGTKQALPFKITWNATWKPGEEAWAEIATTDGVSTRTALQPGVITIPRIAAFKPDGDLGEWPAKSLLPGWVVGCTSGLADAEVRLGWTDQGLAIAITAKDSRVQDTDPRAFWSMDATELFLDSAGSFAPHQAAVTDHQLWLVPLAKEKRVYLGRWKMNAEIPETQYDIKGMASMAKTAGDGYLYEALIPAATINGFAAKAGTAIALDLMLTINGHVGQREVYWPWNKKSNVVGKPELWGRVILGE